MRLSVSPPLIFRTSLQAAVAYVEGNRTGSVLFVAQTPGWHTFYAAPSALGGPRCGSAEFSLRRLFLGDPNCPTFDVNYAVTWRLARHTAGNNPRLAVPKPGETLVTMRIGG